MRTRTPFYALILSPALIVTAFLTVWPVLSVLNLSLYKYNYIEDTRVFRGLGNFAAILADPLFRQSFVNTLEFAAVATTAEVVLGAALALLLYGRFPGKRAVTTMVVFPMMISTMVICAAWTMLYHFEVGLLNHALRALGLAPVRWLISQRMALASVIIVDIWQWTPFVFVILHAGLNTVPTSVLEAAAIDGAGALRTVASVLLPMVSSQVILVALLRTIDTFRVFAKVYALTQGGPGNATETVSYYVYREGFMFFNLGTASAAAVIVLASMAVLVTVYVRAASAERV